MSQELLKALVDVIDDLMLRKNLSEEDALNISDSVLVRAEIAIESYLAQPEQTEPVEICPDCGSKVTWYHCREGTRVVCGDKCQGYKVIASRGRRDECFTKGDL